MMKEDNFDHKDYNWTTSARIISYLSVKLINLELLFLITMLTACKAQYTLIMEKRRQLW